MIFFDHLLVSLFFLAIIIWQAVHQADLFKEKKTISHFWKGVWYAGAIALVTILHIWIYDWWYLLKIPVIGILERAALFDFTLSIAEQQKDPLFYNGKGTTTSEISKEENKLPEWALKTLKIAYIIGFIIAIIFIK